MKGEYRMKNAGSTKGKVSGVLRVWTSDTTFAVPEDVPEGEFDHLGSNMYETRVMKPKPSRKRSKRRASEPESPAGSAGDESSPDAD